MVVFEDKKPDILKCLRQVGTTNSLFFSLIQGCRHVLEDTQILSDWGIQGKLRTAPRIESVNWVAPNAPTIKVNTDGASRGNRDLPGLDLLRRSSGDFLLTYYWRGSDYEVLGLKVFDNH
ncbi:hypothetical protein IFM89_023492 [Coptis chinensis]|uniref:Uncharacterized protein n=1 Tax=Coptis chinensis TaxID=261450 RepID=A0A835I4T9_9MAGN|nr:hypothetical protein IFM89_023492 [Coptis chinensis]